MRQNGGCDMRLRFTNSNGEVIDFLVGGDYAPSDIEGVGDVEAEVQTQKAPFQDGSAYLDSVLTERLISFRVTMVAKDSTEVQARRQRLSRVLNPKLGIGKLEVEDGGVTRYIDCVPDHIPTYPGGRDTRGERYQIAFVDLLAPDPYWKGGLIQTEPTFEPLFEFPFEGEFTMGISRDERLIINDGDAEAPMLIEFRGPAVNPRVTNETTGGFIKVNQTLDEGETMRIDTADGNKSVRFIAADGTERNVFNWIDLDSTFFKLVPGENHLTYTADSNIQGAVVNFYYQQRYNAL